MSHSSKKNLHTKKLMVLLAVGFFVFGAVLIFKTEVLLRLLSNPSTQSVKTQNDEIKLLAKILPELKVLSFKDDNMVEEVKTFEKDLKGSVVLVNFWASWCEPCVIETPDLIELAKKNPSLRIIFVNEDSELADLKSFLKSFPEMVSDRTYLVWDEDRSLMKSFDVALLPESHFFDDQGVFIRTIKGSIDWKKFNINSH